MGLFENVIFYGIGTAIIIGIIYKLIMQLVQQYHRQSNKPNN